MPHWIELPDPAPPPTSPSPDPVVVRLENQVADLRNLVETATVLLKEACDSMDESVSKAADGRWYMKKMPSFINIGWQMRAIIWQANRSAPISRNDERSLPNMNQPAPCR